MLAAETARIPGDVPPTTKVARGARGPRIWDDKVTVVGIGVLTVIIVSAALAPLVAPHDPSAVDLSNRLRPPAWSDGGGWSNLLGTDALGHDILSRIIYGARTSMLIGLSVAIIAGSIGTALGLLAGLKGGIIDSVVMRVIDAQLAFPGLLLTLVVVASFGPGVNVIIGVLAIYGWMVYARLVRANVLQLREQLFIPAAVMGGCGVLRLMRKHLLPNLLAPLLTQAMLELARVVLAEASLSYLGFGIQAPDVAWGLMVAENQPYLNVGWWTVVFPGVALAITVLSVNLLGSWFRVRADPRQRAVLMARTLKRRDRAADR
jgi:peptide/nickel transport system permease protein